MGNHVVGKIGMLSFGLLIQLLTLARNRFALLYCDLNPEYSTNIVLIITVDNKHGSGAA